MNYDACRYAFDCLNSSGWIVPLWGWTLLGGACCALAIWWATRR